MIIDVSNINATVDIIYPVLDIRPKKLKFPTIPKLQLPTLPKLAVQLDVKQTLTLPLTLAIPVLPAPPKLPDPPSLEVIPDFKLPYLPPAPKLPAVTSLIVKIGQIIQKIMQIYCFIIKNNIVYPFTAVAASAMPEPPLWLAPLLAKP